MANAAGFHFDQHFVRTGSGTLHFFESQRSFEVVKHGGFHGRGLARYRGDSESKKTRASGAHSVAQGLAPRRKNSTALAARSTSLCGPWRSTAHWRTTVLNSPSINSAR